MTTATVIDTNVLLVANGRHPDVSPECVISCVARLTEIKKHGVVVIDDTWHIVREYQHKTSPNQPKGAGDVFLKWLLQNLNNKQRVHQVKLTQTAPHCFIEFPAPSLEDDFDAPDRIFAAVSNAHPEKPPVLQAADCKWLDWWAELQAAGIAVTFLCPEDICRFYRSTFPARPPPALPDQV